MSNMFFICKISNLGFLSKFLFNFSTKSKTSLGLATIYDPLEQSLSVANGNFVFASSLTASLSLTEVLPLPLTGANI